MGHGFHGQVYFSRPRQAAEVRRDLHSGRKSCVALGVVDFVGKLGDTSKHSFWWGKLWLPINFWGTKFLRQIHWRNQNCRTPWLPSRSMRTSCFACDAPTSAPCLTDRCGRQVELWSASLTRVFFLVLKWGIFTPDLCLLMRRTMINSWVLRVPQVMSFIFY